MADEAAAARDRDEVVAQVLRLLRSSETTATDELEAMLRAHSAPKQASPASSESDSSAEEHPRSTRLARATSGSVGGPVSASKRQTSARESRKSSKVDSILKRASAKRKKK
ncbi:Uncharacterized protein PBTT_08959 [Plasmodiophora brassicae]|uniref:Uncharacterized protein n=1 Tax=Plasmodiophora brassicae TaxID=37360 RepID=A0A0G4IU97_PLABS|nr:hypothetical protein PBRA_006823 [Plasmodiophora brassicae]SPR00847.1 unnamed protein product [Plasmodiophora brassicae]